MSDSRKYKFFDAHHITESLVSEGAQLIYCREALYPIIEAQVRIREKSRDQLGDIEKALLSIVQTCHASAESISKLMGVEGGKLFPILHELEGRGLIEQEQNNLFKLSELGKLSVQHGVEVVEVDRALLLCGITGKLMPRDLYSIQRMTPLELKQRAQALDLVPEEDKITLTALDLSKIPDRRSVNLPDEAMAIIGVLEHKPSFLRGILVYYQDKLKKTRGEVVFPGATIDWLPEEKFNDFISEPLGFSVRKNPQEVLKEIESILKNKGVGLAGEAELDQYQNPFIAISSVNENVRNLDFRGRPFLMYMGTDRHLPVPIGQFPFGGERGFQKMSNGRKDGDMLFGRTISFRAKSHELKEQVDSLRFMNQAVGDYYRKPPSGRTQKPYELIIERLTQNGIDPQKAIKYGSKYGPKNLQKILNIEDE